MRTLQSSPRASAIMFVELCGGRTTSSNTGRLHAGITIGEPAGETMSPGKLFVGFVRSLCAGAKPQRMSSPRHSSEPTGVASVHANTQLVAAITTKTLDIADPLTMRSTHL